MKSFAFKDDKSAFKDRIMLSIISLMSLVAGILLVVYKPSFWIVSSGFSSGLGIVAIVFAIMLIPGTIYRFFK